MRNPMIWQLLIATIMVVVTVTVHGVGLALLAKALRVETREEHAKHLNPLSPRALGFTVVAVLALFALHGLEIWFYAILYLLGGAVLDLSTAVYFSTISYAAIGFTDAYVAADWRLVAGIEGINGVLLLGWSTAFFVTMIARLGR